MRPLLAAAVSAALALACADSRQPLEPANPTPSFAGATVDRGDVPFRVFAREVESGYTAFIGVTLEETEELCTTGEFNPSNLADELLVSLPTGGLRFLDKGRDMAVNLYDELHETRCDALSVSPYATGTVKVVVTEHVPGENGGAYTFGIKATGIVTTTAGDQLRLHITAQIVVTPDGKEHPLVHIRVTPLS